MKPFLQCTFLLILLQIANFACAQPSKPQIKECISTYYRHISLADGSGVYTIEEIRDFMIMPDTIAGQFQIQAWIKGDYENPSLPDVEATRRKIKNRIMFRFIPVSPKAWKCEYMFQVD